MSLKMQILTLKKIEEIKKFVIMVSFKCRVVIRIINLQGPGQECAIVSVLTISKMLRKIYKHSVTSDLITKRFFYRQIC